MCTFQWTARPTYSVQQSARLWLLFNGTKQASKPRALAGTQRPLVPDAITSLQSANYLLIQDKEKMVSQLGQTQIMQFSSWNEGNYRNEATDEFCGNMSQPWLLVLLFRRCPSPTAFTPPRSGEESTLQQAKSEAGDKSHMSQRRPRRR